MLDVICIYNLNGENLLETQTWLLFSYYMFNMKKQSQHLLLKGRKIYLKVLDMVIRPSYILVRVKEQIE